ESDEYSIRLKSDRDAKTAGRLKAALSSSEAGAFEVLKEDFVGPIIGDQIRKDGLTAMAIALICILIYITARFEWRFALGAIFALVHDVIITTGVFVWSGHEISASVLAALLTIIGYSLNDTIIVFDRIRENLATPKNLPFLQLVNLSINQTLSRTVLTSVTTLFVVLSLWLLGGGAVSDLAYVLVIGVIVGTYSSIFIACTSVVMLDDYGEKRK
ncbi:UNVERIFIED_CONTAM: hypothetical protein GTU68_030530, partial [Idotea baltica]|nr:hypothetical protein [Idotea baltica]